jgi:uncharacterized SAM-binding protein YcdF (DUF218 family)
MSLLALLLLVCIAAALYRRSRVPLFAALAVLFLYCWPPVAWLTAASLEKRYPVTEFPQGEAEAIVVLSASFYPSNPSQPETLPGFATYLRCSHAAWLYKHWKQLPIVVSGGIGQPGGPPIADIMKRQLVGEGVPESMIWEEARSTSTYQNAVLTGNLLFLRGIRRIALVTEGIHMLRADLSFRKEGFDVVPAACAYHTQEQTTPGERLLPNMWAVHTNDEALHEWGGLAVYKLRGWI